MSIFKSRYAWLTAPAIWLTGIITLIIFWYLNTPEWITLHFDQDGASPVEAATIGFFFLQIGMMWLLPPMRKGRSRWFWLTVFTIITMIAIARELDWHKLLVPVSTLPGGTTGTFFKMRFLTNSSNPLSDRLIVLLCFTVTIALCVGTLLYFILRLLKGLIRFHPVCWSIAFVGGTTILILFFDRMPSILHKKLGITLSDKTSSLFSVLEEGQELLLPLFVILAIIQAHFIYVNHSETDKDLELYRTL